MPLIIAPEQVIMKMVISTSKDNNDSVHRHRERQTKTVRVRVKQLFTAVYWAEINTSAKLLLSRSTRDLQHHLTSASTHSHLPAPCLTFTQLPTIKSHLNPLLLSVSASGSYWTKPHMDPHPISCSFIHLLLMWLCSTSVAQILSAQCQAAFCVNCVRWKDSNITEIIFE